MHNSPPSRKKLKMNNCVLAPHQNTCCLQKAQNTEDRIQKIEKSDI